MTFQCDFLEPLVIKCEQLVTNGNTQDFPRQQDPCLRLKDLTESFRPGDRKKHKVKTDGLLITLRP